MRTKHNTKNDSSNALYTVLATVPFSAIDETNSAYRLCIVEKIKNDKCLVYSTFADGYRKYKRWLNINDIKVIQKHECQPDDFNKCCQICGKYGG